MTKVTKRHGKEKQGRANFDGRACWVGVDVHKASYAVAILDEDGQRLEFSTSAEPHSQQPDGRIFFEDRQRAYTFRPNYSRTFVRA